MWLLWFIGCVSEKLVEDAVTDTGLVASDVREQSRDDTWGGLDSAASWVSVSDGYATGGAFADIDGDGDPDLVVAHGNDMIPGHLVVYENSGGQLTEHPVWRNRDAAFYGHLDVGDINNDGWVDVVVSRFLGVDRFDSPGGIEVYLNQGGVLEEIPFWEQEGFFTFSVSFGDMDRDGWLDIAVAVGESYENEPDRARVFRNEDGRGFGEEPVWISPSLAYSFDVAWADFDQDGWLDLALARQQVGHVIYQNQEGVLANTAWWTAAESDGPFEGNTLDVGDVNQDGYLDLVVSDNDQQGGAGAVRLWCGPTLTLCWSMPQPYASAVSLHDWDNDGDLDLAYGGWWSAVHVVEAESGMLNSTPSWRSAKNDIVVEALDWADVDGLPGTELVVTDWTQLEGNRMWNR